MEKGLLALFCVLAFLSACGDLSSTPREDVPAISETKRELATLLSEKALSILQAPDSLELLSLEPNRYGEFDPAKDPSPHLHGFKIEGRAMLDANEIEPILKAYFESAAESNGQHSNCLRPRHGLIATEGKDRVELVISFPCWHSRLYLNGERQADLAHSQRALEHFDAIARAHKLPVFGAELSLSKDASSD
ncbi:MAG: hypothetical protein KDB07_05910 [Planctomycetes bacterium]|nr:hypothetical protein [Planctomycetota bacterium]